jgi:hypothetical protein
MNPSPPPLSVEKPRKPTPEELRVMQLEKALRTEEFRRKMT